MAARRQQEAEQMNQESPALMNELRALRQRKGELEGHLGALQDSRRQLMAQLEGLMRMLKNHQTSSPRSTPNSSPRSGKSPPLPQGPQTTISRNSAHQGQMVGMVGGNANENMQLGGDGRFSTAPPNGTSHLSGGGRPPVRTDLHFAADSVTHAMSSLVRELNSEGSEDETTKNIQKTLDFDDSQNYQEWNEKENSNSQWQEQFAQWNLNSQK
ncbi:hypothetical protein DMENIID0001_059170 [Sergentomyia squamirostris]